MGSAENEESNGRFEKRFRSVDTVQAIIVDVNYDKDLFPWLDPKAVDDAVIDRVSEQVPPELKKPVIRLADAGSFAGPNIYLRFHILGTKVPQRDGIPTDKFEPNALATVALISFVYQKDWRGPIQGDPKQVEYVRQISREEHFDSLEVGVNAAMLTKDYFARLRECIDKNGYDKCTINDLGDFDVNQMRGIEMHPQ